MLKFLKNIFQKKDQPYQTVEVKAEELEQWAERRLDVMGYKEAVLSFFNKVKDNKWMLNEKLELLKEAEVKEKDKAVEEKVKSVVHGHKDNYLREMQRFAESLEIPAEPNLAAAIKFSRYLDQYLGDLAKKTARNYQAAQHLFFEPVEGVFKVVIEINNSVKDFQKFLVDNNLDHLQDFRKKVESLLEEKNKHQRLKEELGWKEEKIKRSKEGKEKQTELINRLKSGEEYELFRTLKEKEEKIKSMLRDTEDESHLFFSKLLRLLKKYGRIAAETKSLQSYLEDPVKAFFRDSELKISRILDELSNNLEQLGADDKEKMAVFDALAKSKGNYLKELQDRHMEQQARAEEIRLKLRRYNLENQIEEAEYKHEHFEEQAVLVSREIEELKVRLTGSGEEQLKEELTGLAREMLKVELKVI
ncbi:MAG: hypothetical protein ABIA37_03300 [Candidatus Woesearchaeota archaeon]